MLFDAMSNMIDCNWDVNAKTVSAISATGVRTIKGLRLWDLIFDPLIIH